MTYELELKVIMEEAKKGNPNQQYQLGLMYLEGDRVPQSYAHAYMWFSIAKTNGYKDRTPKEIERLMRIASENLTPENLQGAKKCVAECINSDYKNCG